MATKNSILECFHKNQFTPNNSILEVTVYYQNTSCTAFLHASTCTCPVCGTKLKKILRTALAKMTGIEDSLSISGDSSSDDSDTDFEDVENDNIDQGAPEIWRQAFEPGDTTFQASTSSFHPSFDVDENSTPLDILKKFVTDDMLQEVSNESNKLVAQVKSTTPKAFSSWKDVSVFELWRFLAVNLAMGLVQKPSIKSYWSKNKILATPSFGDQMSRNRFEAILAALHFNDKQTVPPNCTDRFIKLGNFLKNLLVNFNMAVIPGEYLCLDESLLGYKGRLSFKQFNPMKRSRFGLLFYILMDCTTGMVLDILPYQGKSTNLPANLVKDLKRGGATVVHMVEKYFGKNHKVVTDNFFNSPGLAHRLLENGTFLLGTAQKRRIGMPKMTGKLKSGDIKTYCNGKMLLERWMDRREVIMMNTFLPHAMTYSAARNPHNSRLKPNSVLVYNKTMGTVDSMDRTIKPYATLRKTYKWYKKVFFHLIDVAIYNSYQAYKSIPRTGPPKHTTYMDFVLSIIEAIFEEYPVERSAPGRPTVSPKPEMIKYHIPIKKGKADCALCRSKGLRCQTQIKCSVCNVRLCLQKGDTSCYAKYHEELQKPKQKKRVTRPPLSDVQNSLELSGSFHPQVASTPEQNSVQMDVQFHETGCSESLLADLVV